jgi:hypothetical protein
MIRAHTPLAASGTKYHVATLNEVARVMWSARALISCIKLNAFNRNQFHVTTMTINGPTLPTPAALSKSRELMREDFSKTVKVVLVPTLALVLVLVLPPEQVLMLALALVLELVLV